MFISFMHNIEKIVKPTLKILQCLHRTILKSYAWTGWRNRDYISTLRRVFYKKDVMKTKFIVKSPLEESLF